jgi:hypothetical protein
MILFNFLDENAILFMYHWHARKEHTMVNKTKSPIHIKELANECRIVIGDYINAGGQVSAIAEDFSGDNLGVLRAIGKKVTRRMKNSKKFQEATIAYDEFLTKLNELKLSESELDEFWRLVEKRR